MTIKQAFGGWVAYQMRDCGPVYLTINETGDPVWRTTTEITNIALVVFPSLSDIEECLMYAL